MNREPISPIGRYSNSFPVIHADDVQLEGSLDHTSNQVLLAETRSECTSHTSGENVFIADGLSLGGADFKVTTYSEGVRAIPDEETARAEINVLA